MGIKKALKKFWLSDSNSPMKSWVKIDFVPRFVPRSPSWYPHFQCPTGSISSRLMHTAPSGKVLHFAGAALDLERRCPNLGAHSTAAA